MSDQTNISPEQIRMMKDVLIEHVPHARALGMKVEDAARGEAWLSVPYNEDLVGDIETGVLHGGVIAVQLSLPERIAIATLDLRIDYMKPATPKLDLNAHTHCYKVTKNIAFVRGAAYHEDEEDPIATCVGNFMLAANRAMPMPISEELRQQADQVLGGGKAE